MPVTLNWSSVRVTAVRLLPGEDLKSRLVRIAKENQLQAAAVISVVGSLSKVSLRMANRPDATEFEDKHEIISLSGTISKDGIHLHMSVANSEGQLYGGHVMEGSIIYTTAEIVIAEMPGLTFKRKACPKSGFHELDIGVRAELD